MKKKKSNKTRKSKNIRWNVVEFQLTMKIYFYNFLKVEVNDSSRSSLGLLYHVPVTIHIYAFFIHTIYSVLALFYYFKTYRILFSICRSVSLSLALSLFYFVALSLAIFSPRGRDILCVRCVICCVVIASCWAVVSIFLCLA